MNLDTLREKSALLRALANTEVSLFESAASQLRVSAGEVLFDQDGSADAFYIVVEGRIGLELTSPGKNPMVIQTLGSGDLLGVSWLFSPHRWNWRARAMVDSELVAFDADVIRSAMEQNRDLALEVLGVVAGDLADRLHRTRLQLLDLYRGDSQ
ncbi:MAG: cyclic nucleotide-binding domain-containing protein [Acidimicrobiia bacterium]